MLIGISEAGRRLGVSTDSARRALVNAGFKLVQIGARALAVEESDLAEFIQQRGSYGGRGRPRKKKPLAEPSPADHAEETDKKAAPTDL